MDTPGAQLRELLAGDDLLVAPGVYDGISAAIVGQLPFSVAYMTGAGVSAAAYGLPDVGLLTLTEMAERARMIVGVTGLPVIADADTGYGSPINVVRTVREYERAGVAAIQLEDQRFPKRCGHLAGKEVIGTDDFARSLTAALDTRTDALIVARTDARASHGIDEAIARGKRYAELGADVIFVEAPQTVEEIEQIAAEISAPLLLNMVPGGRTPEIPAARMTELGYKIVIHPGVALGSVAKAALDSFATLLEDVPGIDVSPDIMSFFDLFGLARWNELGQRYA